MKTLLIAFLCLLYVKTDGQDSVTSLKTSIVFEGITCTQYKNPMLGFMCEEVFTDRKTGVNFIARIGYWYNPRQSFKVVQAGTSFPIKANTDLGFYLINYNGYSPIPKEELKNEGYQSPFSIFLTTYPFHNVHREINRSFGVSTEVSYFTNKNMFGFRVSFNYKLNRGETRWDKKKHYK